MSQWNELALIQREVINPVRSHPAKCLALRPTHPLDYERFRFDLDSLSFLLETDFRQCLTDLLIAENRFQTTAKALNKRSSLHLQYAQPLLEKAGIIEGGDYTKQQIESALGNRLSVQLSRLTEDVIEHVDNSVIYLKETSDKLHDALKQLYPKGCVINFEPINIKE